MLLTTTHKKQIEGIGEVLFKRSTGRYLRLHVDEQHGIVLHFPAGIPEQHALRFLDEKKAWLRRSLLKQNELKAGFTIFSEHVNFKTRLHTLYLARHDKNTIRSVVSGNKIVVWFPDHAPAEDPRIQRVIRKAVEEAWRIEAKSYLPERVKMLATKYNLQYKSITVKNAKTRWGSCSGDNSINLNLQLMRLPEQLIDYVILHELMHTVHKNHQKAFWSALEDIFPAARRLDKELNRYHLKYW